MSKILFNSTISPFCYILKLLGHQPVGFKSPDLNIPCAQISLLT